MKPHGPASTLYVSCFQMTLEWPVDFIMGKPGLAEPIGMFGRILDLY